MTEKLALTGRTTSVIAHEINNPLEAITNLLHLLNESVKDDPVARSYIGLAESELQRLSGITKQTLRWAKESLQKAAYGTAGTLFRDVLRLLAGKIRNRQVILTLENGADVRFHGVFSQVSQVLANLISNTVQAVSAGGRVWFSSREDGDLMEMVVRDERHGMTEETLLNLFRPFYSTKGDLGNSFGLYISREIVERHGGTLVVSSQLGGGTELRVRLPAIPLATPTVDLEYKPGVLPLAP